MTKNAHDYGLAGETATDWHFRCGNQQLSKKGDAEFDYVSFFVMLWRLNGVGTSDETALFRGDNYICYNFQYIGKHSKRGLSSSPFSCIYINFLSKSRYPYRLFGGDMMSKRKKGYLESLIATLLILAVIFMLDIATVDVFIIVGVIVLINLLVFEVRLFFKN